MASLLGETADRLCFQLLIECLEYSFQKLLASIIKRTNYEKILTTLISQAMGKAVSDVLHTNFAQIVVRETDISIVNHFSEQGKVITNFVVKNLYFNDPDRHRY